MAPCILKRFGIRAIVSLCVTVITSSPLLAQVSPPSLDLERRVGPGPALPPLPEFLPEELPSSLELPPLPSTPPDRGERLSQSPSVFVKDIRVEGNTAFPDEQLALIVRPYEGREITAEELLRLRDALTLHYINAGYVNSGAVIPDQDVVEGVIIIRIVEGQLDEVRVHGLKALREGFVKRRIALGAEPPLNVNTLKERLQLLLTDPAIERLDARLGPGAEPGSGQLEVDVVEARRFFGGLRFGNDRPPSIGSEHGEVFAGLRNVIGVSDPLLVRYGRTRGANDFEGSYSVPLTAENLRLRLYGSYDDAKVVESPFRELDIAAKTWTFDVGLRYPLHEAVGDELAVGIGLSRRHSETFLLDRPFSFAPGVRDGVSDVTALRFTGEWVHRRQEEVLSALSTLSWGIDALGATNNPSAPDSQYLSWLGQGQWVRRIGESESSVLARVAVQLATDPLLPIEKFAIGGLDTVRGYRENFLVRDNAVVFTVEPRIALFRLPLPFLSSTPADGMVQFAPFFDIGRGWDEDDDVLGPKTIYSLGLGVLWTPSPRLTAALYWGYPLRNVPEPEEETLQDYGIHFEFRFFY